MNVFMKKGWVLLILSILTGSFFFYNPCLWANPVKDAHVESQLISEVNSIHPDEPFWVAIRLTMDEEWHTYWKNPGDSGLPVEVEWILPDWIKAGELQWPPPKRIWVDPFMTYGYEGEVELLTQLYPEPVSFNRPAEVSIEAKLNYLACRVECLPGKAILKLNLPVSQKHLDLNENDQTIFQRAKKQQQDLQEGALAWTVKVYDQQDDFIFSLLRTGFYEFPQQQLPQVYFYPEDGELIEHAEPQNLIAKGHQQYELYLKKSSIIKGKSIPRMKGVMQIRSEDNGPGSSFSVDQPVLGIEEYASPAQQRVPAGRFFSAILFAFLGGIILNVMPCVLPVLSIKIFKIIQQAHDQQRAIMRQAFLYTAGILVSFWLLFFIFALLRLTGNQIGWGFQFQSPVFLIFMSALMFLLGLNFFGVYEIGTSLAGLGGKRQAKDSGAGSFWNGFLATIVATPCTAPFMGTALGFALSQPIFPAFIVFSALGLGLAFPFIIISFYPQGIRFIPRPGAWMMNLKKFMGFPLIATALWLSQILGNQFGLEALLRLYFGLLLMALGVWVYGTWSVPSQPFNKRVWALCGCLFFIILGFWLAASGIQKQENMAKKYTSVDSLWQPYSEEIFNRLLAEGKNVFIDFTADWCLTCQVNKKVALQNLKVIEKFQQYDIILLKADWTANDPVVTQALQRYGKASIPYNVLHTPKQKTAVLEFPEVLTAGLVIEKLEHHFQNKGDVK